MKLITKIAVLTFCMTDIIFCKEIIVKIQQGQLAGEVLPTTVNNGRSYFSFKGIPYAKPPVGNLRFKAPEEPEPWKGVRNATAHGNVCPQFNPLSNQFIPGSEDCLFLNVYTPNLNPKTRMPVIFYIFGGAFVFGSGDTDFYGPDFLVSNDVVVVTINHRLDALGFLSLETEELSGNAGLKDQLAALKWVQKNIKTFGGDPGKVTIMGGASGGTSAYYHLISRKSKGLFKRAISWSGSPSCDWATSYKPRERAIQLAKNLGLDSENLTEVLHFLQEVPYDKLIHSKTTILASEEKSQVLFKMGAFAPVIEIPGEDSFITQDDYNSLETGNVNKADVLFAYNSHESLILVDLYNSTYITLFNKFRELFVPSSILVSSTPDEILALASIIVDYYYGSKKITTENIAEFVNFYSDTGIAYHVNRFARKWPNPRSTYFMKLSYYSGRNYFGQQGARYNIEGATHFDEIFYLFNPATIPLPLEPGSMEYSMVQNTVKAIVNFAKYGNPNNDGSLGVNWPQFDAKKKAYINFKNDGLSLEYGPDNENTEFWRQIIESTGMKF